MKLLFVNGVIQKHMFFNISFAKNLTTSFLYPFQSARFLIEKQFAKTHSFSIISEELQIRDFSTNLAANQLFSYVKREHTSATGTCYTFPSPM